MLEPRAWDTLRTRKRITALSERPKMSAICDVCEFVSYMPSRSPSICVQKKIARADAMN
jgi:hypothetical protein